MCNFDNFENYRGYKRSEQKLNFNSYKSSSLQHLCDLKFAA